MNIETDVNMLRNDQLKQAYNKIQKHFSTDVHTGIQNTGIKL